MWVFQRFYRSWVSPLLLDFSLCGCNLIFLSESSTVSDSGAGGTEFNGKRKCHRVDAQLLSEISFSCCMFRGIPAAVLRQKQLTEAPVLLRV